MDDRTKNELWKKEMEKRNKGNKIMLLGILFIVLSIEIQVRYIEFDFVGVGGHRRGNGDCWLLL